MTFEEKIEKAQKVIDLAIKADVHAFLLLAGGVFLTLTHHQDPGLILAGLAIFKGRSS